MMGQCRIWVDVEYYKMLKKEAAEQQMSLLKLTKRLAKGRNNTDDKTYEFPF